MYSNIKLVSPDTILYFNYLQIKRKYSFQATIVKDIGVIHSNTLQVQTLDTTSHDIINWQTWTFSGYSSTVFDVAIIDENNIWAVGEIHVGDTLYNAVQWDGTNWKYYQLQFQAFPENPQTSTYPARSILAFGTNDIWISCGSQVTHFNGIKQLNHQYIPAYVNKMWGTDSKNIFAVGWLGNIAHFDGTSWQKIESGTNVNLTDVWGTPDGQTVWICGNEDNKPTVLLKYSKNKLEKIFEDTRYLYVFYDNIISGGIKSIWAINDKKLYLGTSVSLYRSTIDSISKPNVLWHFDPNIWSSTRVRANNVNDIFTAGYNGRVWHFNGNSWKMYEDIADPRDELYGLDVKNNIIVVAGNRYNNGIENYGLIHIGHI